MHSSRRQALVHGLGRFGGGIAATRYLLQQGHLVRVIDRASSTELAASLRRLGDHPNLTLNLGNEDLANLVDVDLVVANPGVPDSHPLLAAARQQQIPITQEINLFATSFPGSVVLVTGTNGKSSTAHLLAAALQQSRMPTLLGGNLGHSLLDDRQGWRREQIAVLEISSFQASRLPTDLDNVIATVLTPVTSDHLDWHGSLNAYRQAKAQAMRAAKRFLVLPEHGLPMDPADCQAKAHYYYSAAPPQGDRFGIDKGWLSYVRDGKPSRLLHRHALRSIGSFQQQNALAAAAAALALGAPHHTAALGLAAAPPLPHRLQPVRTGNGLRIFDNSVSTQAASTLSAMQTLSGTIHWIGGGKQKDESPLVVARTLAGRMATAHLFGSVAAELATHLPANSTTVHQSLEQAIDAALAVASPGDAILFSPAFASFDQYANFAERAQAFLRHITDWRTPPTTLDSQSAS